MSTSIGSVKIALEAVDNISGVLGSVQGSISGLSGVATILGQNIGAVGGIVSGLGGPMAGLGGIIQGFAAGGPAGAGIAMIGQAVGFLQGSVKAAEDSERVMAILRTTVENQGTAWGTVKDAINETLLKMQATTRYSDEELGQALTTLVGHGMDVEGAMNALNTAMDTATGTGKPLQTIVEGIGKAYEGQDSALTRLVPAIGDLDEKMGAGATSGDKFQAALGILNDRFGGTAAADAATFAGVQERMANAWDQFQETVGTAVLPALTDLMNGLMNIGTQAIGPLMESLGELWSALFGDDVDLKGFGEFLQNYVIAVIKDLARFIREDVVPVVKAFHEAFQTASDLIGPPLKAMADAIGGFLKTLHDSFQGFYTWLVGGSLWNDLWNQILSTASELIDQLIGDLGTKLFDPMTKAFTTTIDAVKDLWSKGWDAMQTAATTIWDGLTTDVGPWIEGIKTNIGTTMEGLKTGWETTWNGIQTGAQTVWNTITTNVTPWIDGLNTKVTTTTDALKTAWDTNWGAVKTTLDTLLPQVQTFLNTKFDEMKGYVETSTGAYGPTMTLALGGMQGAMNAGFLLVKGDWQGALDAISGALSQWGDAAKGIMDGIMGSLQNAVDSGISIIQSAWTGLTSGLQATTQAAAAPMQAATQTVMDSVSGAVTGFWNWLTGGSYWPEHLDAMRSMTDTKLSEVTNSFTKFGQDVTQKLTSALQGAQQAAQQGMAAISATLGSVADTAVGMTYDAADQIGNALVEQFGGGAWQDLWTSAGGLWSQLVSGATSASDAVAQSMAAMGQGSMSTSGKLDIFDQAVQRGMQSAENLANCLVILRGGLDASDLTSEKLRQTLEAMGFAYEKNIYGNYQLSSSMDDLRQKLASGAISAEEMDRALEGIGVKSLAVSLGLATVNTEALSQAMTRLGTISDPEAWESNWEALAGGKVAFDELIDSMMDNGLTYQEIMSNVTYDTKQMTQEVQSVTQDGMAGVTATFQDAFSTVTNAASDFWNWLVGGSVWPEGMQGIADSTLQGMTQITQMTASALQVIRNAWETAQVNIQEGTLAFFKWTTTKFTEALGTIDQLWRNAWMQVESIISNIYANIQNRSSEWWNMLSGLFTASLSNLQQVWGSAWTMMEQALSASLMRMSSIAQSVLGSILMQVQNVMMRIQQAAVELKTQLVSGSIWPDMLGAMESMTSTAMDNIASAVAIGFNAVVSQAQSSLAQVEAMRQQAARIASIPISRTLEYVTASMGAPATSNALWVPPTPMNLSGAQLQNYANALAEGVFQQTYGRPSAAGPATAQEVLNATLPINVVIDGVTVSRVVEKRMVQDRLAKMGGM